MTVLLLIISFWAACISTAFCWFFHLCLGCFLGPRSFCVLATFATYYVRSSRESLEPWIWLSLLCLFILLSSSSCCAVAFANAFPNRPFWLVIRHVSKYTCSQFSFSSSYYFVNFFTDFLSAINLLSGTTTASYSPMFTSSTCLPLLYADVSLMPLSFLAETVVLHIGPSCSWSSTMMRCPVTSFLHCLLFLTVSEGVVPPCPVIPLSIVQIGHLNCFASYYNASFINFPSFAPRMALLACLSPSSTVVRVFSILFSCRSAYGTASL